MMLMREGGRKSLTWSQIIDMGWNKASVTLRDDNRIWEGNHNHRVIHKRRNSGILWGNEIEGLKQPATHFCILPAIVSSHKTKSKFVLLCITHHNDHNECYQSFMKTIFLQLHGGINTYKE